MKGAVVSPRLVHDPPGTAAGSETVAVAETERRAGPAAAVVLAAGLASFSLGLLSVLTAASGSISSALTLSDRVGELSGVTTVATVIFFAAWFALALVWRRADPPLARVVAATASLIALGLLGTFPPVFNALGG